MSLRGFHLAFITLATSLAFIVGWWGVGQGNDPVLGTASIAIGIALLVYGIWFLRKFLRGKKI